MIVPSNSPYVDADVYCQGAPNGAYPGSMIASPSDIWDWQVLPQGLIYRSYWAGVKEPRLGIQLMKIEGGHSFWDPTVGARVGLIRFGTTEGLRPQGWEWDVEGAAEPRLTLDQDRDLETVDFRAGTLITYGVNNWQFKFGYYHLRRHGPLIQTAGRSRGSFNLAPNWRSRVRPATAARLFSRSTVICGRKKTSAETSLLRRAGYGEAQLAKLCGSACTI